MEDKKYRLYDGVELKVKEEPTAADLQALKELGIDLLNEGNYAATVLQCFLDMKKMRKLVSIIFEGNIPKTISPKIKGPVIEAALRDFFGKFGLHFLS